MKKCLFAVEFKVNDVYESIEFDTHQEADEFIDKYVMSDSRYIDWIQGVHSINFSDEDYSITYKKYADNWLETGIAHYSGMIVIAGIAAAVLPVINYVIYFVLRNKHRKSN